MSYFQNLLFGVVASGWLVGIAVQGFSQATPAANLQANVSDAELIVFVKAYVDNQKVRQKYEPTLMATTDDEQARQIQDQASAELKQSLAKQNLTIGNYNRIYTAVNGDDALPKKALQLIEQE